MEKRTVSSWRTTNESFDLRKPAAFLLILCAVALFSCDTGGVDPSPPQVTSTNPFNGAAGLDYNYADFNIYFSEEMTDDFSYTVAPTIETNGRWSSNNRTFYIIFQESLAQDTAYAITLNPGGSGTAFQNIAGTPLASDMIFTFSTGATTDPPSVFSSTPANGATGVPADTNVTVTFSRTMKTGSYSYNFNRVPASGTWADSTTFVLDPTDPLQANTTYTLTLNPVPSWQGFRSSSNVRVQEYTTITFTTEP